MSANYTVLILRLRQNVHIRAFGMVAAGTSVIHAANQFGCSSVIVHNIVRRYEQTGISNNSRSRSDSETRPLIFS